MPAGPRLSTLVRQTTGRELRTPHEKALLFYLLRALNRLSPRRPGLVPPAHVGRGSSDSSPSPEGVGKPSFTARIERPPFYRGLTPHLLSASLPRSVFSETTGVVSTARVERGPPNSSPSPEGVGKPSFTACIERPLLYRGGSASKKGTWPLPSHPSEAARCVSEGVNLSC